MRHQRFIISIYFLIVISIPLTFQVTGFTLDFNNSENRALTEKPQLGFVKTRNVNTISHKVVGVYRDVMDYKTKFNRYYEDQFIFKSILFKLFLLIKSEIFEINPLPNKVVKGNDGWFFLSDNYGGNPIIESKGIENFIERDIEVITQKLIKRHKWLKKLNINFIVAVAPNKLSIYGDKLDIIKSNKKTKFEQIKLALKGSEVNFIDLSKYFNQFQNKILFHKTDSHWNDFGAYLGYKSLIDKIKLIYPDVDAVEMNDFIMNNLVTTQNDLTRLLDIQINEEQLIFNYKNSKATKIRSKIIVPKNVKINHKNYEMRFISNVNKLKVLVFRDSFSSNLIKYLKENFGEIIFIWDHDFNFELIQKEKPDIVIYEIIERNLDKLLVN